MTPQVWKLLKLASKVDDFGNNSSFESHFDYEQARARISQELEKLERSCQASTPVGILTDALMRRFEDM